MMRHRRQAPNPADTSSSSDEEDAFSALSRKTKRQKTSNETKDTSKNPSADLTTAKDEEDASSSKKPASLPTSLPAPITSSMKRHHGAPSSSRKAKMDALLVELQQETHKVDTSARPQRGFVPEKKGSFVEPGEEHLTTNIFVGNLAPEVTEDELTDLFRQFGDLYSIKIMWPRTAEERARNRNTGFVCFMNRQDAEDAMRACDETDPFNCGRRIMMRWGKNVKKLSNVIPIQQRSLQRPLHEPKSSSSSSAAFDPAIDLRNAIRVLLPPDQRRLRFISTVASFIAKDGSALEQKLSEAKAGDPSFDFMRRLSPQATEQQRLEHIFYTWRVYSFCQGDGIHTWRTEPFRMFQNGPFWIPPAIDQGLARREEEAARAKEEDIMRQRQQRRIENAKRDYMTGRQLEQSQKGGVDGGAPLTAAEREELDKLFRKQLCASRESICQAMAFCFEKSGSAKEISSALEELLLEDQVSVSTRIARLYLMSDVLFNSQQPGVRFAYLYRDAIEQMAPAVFESLGKHGDGQLGRLTMNKLASAVRLVLNAWNQWNAFNQTLLNELLLRYRGEAIPEEEEEADGAAEDSSQKDGAKEGQAGEDDASKIRTDRPIGEWKAVDPEEEQKKAEKHRAPRPRERDRADTLIHGQEPAATDEDDADGEPMEEHDMKGRKETGECAEDGTPLDESEWQYERQVPELQDRTHNPDREPPEEADTDVDGEPVDDDFDGAPLSDDDDPDGEPIDDDEDVDGSPID